MWCTIPCIYSPKLVTSKLTSLTLQPPITVVLLHLLSSNYRYRTERVDCFHFKLSPFENGHKTVFCTSLMAEKDDQKCFKELTTHEKCKNSIKTCVSCVQVIRDHWRQAAIYYRTIHWRHFDITSYLVNSH